MGDFGFDPYIVSNLQTAGNQNSNNDMQTLADLVGKRTQNQVAQYGLQRQQGLADIVRQNAGAFSSNPYAQALAQGGYGQEAFEAQQQAIQRQALFQSMMEHTGTLLRSKAAMVKTPEQAKQYLGGISPDGRSYLGLPDPEDPEALQKIRDFRASAITPEEEAKNKLEAQKTDIEASKATMENKKLGLELWKLEHPGANRPVPENEASKLENMLQVPGIVGQLKQLHSQIGASALTPGPGVGAAGKYRDFLKANETLLAAGLLPQGRETPGAAGLVHGMMPTELASPDRAKAAFDAMGGNLLKNVRAQIDALKAGGSSPAQIAKLEQQYTAAQKALGAKPAQSVDRRMEHFRSQLEPGERLVMNAAGKAKAIGKGENVPAGFSEVP